MQGPRLGSWISSVDAHFPRPQFKKARPRNRFIPNNRGALLLSLLPLIPPLHFYLAFSERELINRSEKWATIRRQVSVQFHCHLEKLKSDI
jgi:hypothetical protein